MKKTLFIIGIIILFTSCIPTKKLTYFQGEPNNKNSVHRLQNTPYKLQVNDIIDIKIKAADEALVSLFKTETQGGNTNINESYIYFKSYSIDQNGMIRIPYIGELNVLGYTEKEVRLKIENELSKMFKNMNEIFVNVKLAGIRYTVIGEIKTPGTKVIFQNQANIIEAIANSGDILMTGNRKKIIVIRNNINGIKKFNIDLTSLDFFNKDGFIIQPNDIIYIEPLKQKSWGTGDTGAKSMATIITALSLLTTSILLINRL